MIPRTLSASSLKSASGCLARFKAENMQRSANRDNIPAMIGTSVHGGLEEFVKATRLSDEPHAWEFAFLEKYYKQSYTDTFGSTDYSTPDYKDGLSLTQKWFDRTDLTQTEVLSAEVKSNFPVKTSIGPIPVTYIWDRCDKLDDETVRVVDYKTIRAPLKASDLKSMIQPRLYSLAAQFQFPWAKRIWVQFDMLRWDSVGTVFDVEENREMYYYIKREAERILAADEENPPESLNADCRFCIRKAECTALASHSGGGGILNKPLIDLVRRKQELDAQMEGLKWLGEEIDELLLKEAAEREELEFEVESEDGSEKFDVQIKGKSQRSIDASTVRAIIGDELAVKYGNLGVTQVDKIIKSGDVSKEQIKQLNEAMGKTFTAPKSYVKKRDL